jgi:DNA-binding MarR family transcriptional regulator
MLHEVKRSQSIGISDLAARLSIHQSTCSQLVEKLVRGGHVKKARRAADQRRVELKVTVKGDRLLARAPGPAEGMLPEAIAELTGNQIRTLSRGLAYVIAALDMVDETASEKHLGDL